MNSFNDGYNYSRSRTRIRSVGTIDMFIGQFFKENLIRVILEVLEFITGSQVELENDILMDYDKEWFILTTLYVTYVCRLVLQGEYEYHS